MSGKIKSTDMKVNWYDYEQVGRHVDYSFFICSLIQAALGCLPVQEFALNQDTQVHVVLVCSSSITINIISLMSFHSCLFLSLSCPAPFFFSPSLS